MSHHGDIAGGDHMLGCAAEVVHDDAAVEGQTRPHEPLDIGSVPDCADHEVRLESATGEGARGGGRGASFQLHSAAFDEDANAMVGGDPGHMSRCGASEEAVQGGGEIDNSDGLAQFGIAFLCHHFSREQALLRVFILRAAADPRVRDEGAHYVALLEEGVVALLTTRSADYPHRDVDKTVRTAYSLVVDSLSWRTAFGADFHPHSDQTEADWQRRLIDVVLAYLLTPTAR